MTTTPTTATPLTHGHAPGDRSAVLASPRFRIPFIGMALSCDPTRLPPEQDVDHPFESRGPAGLHQHDVAGTERAERSTPGFRIVDRLHAVQVGANRHDLDPQRR